MKFPTGFFKKEVLKPKRIRVTFSSDPGTVTVTKHQLRFGKAFAYSFGMDDTLEDSATIARPLFSGGNIYYQDGTDLNRPGLYYTDGCGNDIAFNGQLYLVGSWMIQGVNNFYMGTDAFKKMYAYGWAYFNHSWSHQDNDSLFSPDPATKIQQLYAEIKNNYDFIKSVSGIKMMYFSGPSNYPPYKPVADTFLQNKVNFGAVGDEYFAGRSVESLLSTNKWDYMRTFINDFEFTRTAADLTRISQYLGSLGPTNHPWIHESTHRMNLGEAATTLSANMRYLTAKDYYGRIEATYGKGGADNIWFANAQEVYEYLRAYQNSILEIKKNGAVVDITIDFSRVDSDFRNHALSLNVQGGANIASVEYLNFDTTSHKITGSSALVNASYKPKYERSIFNRLRADVAVFDYEAAKTLAYKTAAQDAVTLLPNGTFRTALQARLDAVVLIPDSRTFQVDFGSNLTGRVTPAPWNNFSAADSFAAGTTISNLLDTMSTASGLSVTLTSAWTVESGVDPSATGQIYPVSATRDTIIVVYPRTGTLEINGCQSGKTYTVNILSARAWIGDMTPFVVQGVTKSINAKNNISTLLTWSGVIPVAGKITVSVTPASGNTAYLNVMEIIET